MTEQRAVHISIPYGLSFAALKLARDLEAGNISFDWRTIEAICEASGVDVALFRDQREDDVAGLIVAWYAEHRQRGGDADPVAEELIREVRLEDAMGLYKIGPGEEN